MRTSLLPLILTVSLITHPARAETVPPDASNRPSPQEDAPPVTDDVKNGTLPPSPAQDTVRGGFFLGVGVGLLTVVGKPFSDGLDVGMGGTFLLGAFFNHRVGLVGGVRVGIDYNGEFDCTPEDKKSYRCGASSFNFPVLLQVAWKDRRNGFFTQFGPSIASSFVSFLDKERMTRYSPVNGQVGLGYRATQRNLFGLDVLINADAGRYGIKNQRFTDDARKDVFYTIDISLLLHWAP